MKQKKRRPKCEAATEFCSNQCVATYGVNGSEKEGKTFKLCIACVAILRRARNKLKQV